MEKSKNSYQLLAEQRNRQYNVIALLTALVLFLSPFFRGLFFEEEFFYAAAALVVLFCGFLIREKISGMTTVLGVDPLGLAAWGLVGAYLLSTFVAVNLRGSLGEIMRWGTYLLVYYLVAYGTRNRRDIDNYLSVLYGAGIVVALAGLGTAFGTFDFFGAFEKETGRILSTLQYANSLAVYLNAILIFGLYLGIKAENKVFSSLFAMGNYILFITFLGTQSRGAWLVFILVTVILVLFLPSKTRLKAVNNLLAVIIASLLVAAKVISFTGGGTAGTYWSWLFSGLLVAALLQYGLSFLSERVTNSAQLKTNKKTLVTGAIAVAVLVVVGVILLLSNPDLLPEQLATRVKSINLEQHSVQERFYFYKDAIKIIADYPLLGTGGKGWEALYPRYQSYLYISNQVHSHFLQVWVEAGIIVFLMFLAVWGAFFYTIVKAWRVEGTTDRTRAVCLLVAALTLGLHSMIDFNLSLSAVSLVLWTVFGLATACRRITGATQEQSVNPRSKAEDGLLNRTITWGAVILAILIFFGALSFGNGIKHAKVAVEAMQNQSALKAQTEFESAIAFDPFHAAYVADLGQVYLVIGSQQKDNEMLKKALVYEQKAAALNSGDAKIHKLKARAHLALGDHDSGIKEVETLLANGPWVQENYEFLTDLYFNVGKYFYATGERAKSKPYFDKAVEMPARLTAQIAKLTPDMKKLWVRDAMLEVSPTMAELVVKSKEHMVAP